MTRRGLARGRGSVINPMSSDDLLDRFAELREVDDDMSVFGSAVQLLRSPPYNLDIDPHEEACGSFGCVFALGGGRLLGPPGHVWQGRPSPWVIKITNDPTDAAAWATVLQKRLLTRGLPRAVAVFEFPLELPAVKFDGAAGWVPRGGVVYLDDGPLYGILVERLTATDFPRIASDVGWALAVLVEPGSPQEFRATAAALRRLGRREPRVRQLVRAQRLLARAGVRPMDLGGTGNILMSPLDGSWKLADLGYATIAKPVTVPALADVDWSRLQRRGVVARRAATPVELVVALGADLFEVPLPVLLSKTRKAPVVRARQAIMSALYAHGVGVVAAGEALNRDHSAVSYGVRAARLRARKDEKYAEVIQRLTQRAGRVLGKGRGNKSKRLGYEKPQPWMRTPTVRLTRQDLQDSVGHVTMKSVRRDYAPRGKHTVYAAYVDFSELPTPRLAEDEDEDDDGDWGGYDWSEIHRGGSYPPAKVLVDAGGVVHVLDGNHRLTAWDAAGYNAALMWVVQARPTEQGRGNLAHARTVRGPSAPAKGRTARRTISDAPHYTPSRLWKDKNRGSYSFDASVVTADLAVSALVESICEGSELPIECFEDFPDPWLGIEDDDLVLYIDKLAFTAGRRSRGWGTRFARAIEAWGKRQGAVGGLLHAGALWGGREAAGFWEKQGYEITDLGDGLMGWKFWGSGAERGRGNLAPTARTAITRGGPSAPAKALQRKKLIRGKVLDYGSGRGEDAEWLRSQGLKVTAYDPHHGPKKKPTGGFDTILVTYVLNVLPAKSQTELVRSVCKLLSPGGRAYLTARTDTCPAPATGVQTCVTAVAGGKVVASGGGFKTWEVRR